MKIVKRIWTLSIFCLVAFSFGQNAQAQSGGGAGFYVDSNLLYQMGSSTLTTDTGLTRMHASGMVGAAIKMWAIGWDTIYSQDTETLSATTEQTITGLRMGPKFILLLGKGGSFSLGAGYYFLADATYTDTASAEYTLEGTSYLVDVGYTPQLTNNLSAGVRIIYENIAYTRSTNASDTVSDVSYVRSSVFPVLSISLKFF